MFTDTDGLVLREVHYKESDRILTLFTVAEGKITVKARGALRKSSHFGAATQQLTWSEFTLFQNKDKWSVNEATVKEGFDGLRTDFVALSLGSYIAECIDAMTLENEPEPELLQLALNTLYALSHNLYPQDKIKAAFELRLMALTGYTPDVRGCAVCGADQPEAPVLSIAEGRICCRHCCGASHGLQMYLGEEGLAAMRYIINAPAKRLFSFELSDEGQFALNQAAEMYLIQNTERRFPTLDYYKSLIHFGGDEQ